VSTEVESRGGNTDTSSLQSAEARGGVMGAGAGQRLISVPQWMYCHLKQVRRRAIYRITHLGRRRRVEGSSGCISTAMGSQIASGILSSPLAFPTHPLLTHPPEIV